MHALLRQVAELGVTSGQGPDLEHLLEQYAADKGIETSQLKADDQQVGAFLDFLQLHEKMTGHTDSKEPFVRRYAATSISKADTDPIEESDEETARPQHRSVQRTVQRTVQPFKQVTVRPAGQSGQKQITGFFKKTAAGPAAPQASGAISQAEPSITGRGSESRLADDLDLVNQRIFGNSNFRPMQRAVIAALMQGQNVFVLMPTGGGKSLCYQLPAVLKRGVAVVVSPLVSLMQDQVSALCGLALGGVPASFLNSMQSAKERNAVMLELSKDRPTCKLLYVTPEQLAKSGALMDKLTRLHKNGLLSLMVVDEAHCVSHWGHDFRPEYNQLGKIMADNFPKVPILAATATATHRVRADIIRSLKMKKSCRLFEASFVRSNLTFRVVNKDNMRNEDGTSIAEEKLLEYIRKQGPQACGIVYCMTRDYAEKIAYGLQEEGGIKVCCYHAGMTNPQRVQAQNAWFSGKAQVCVATIAFGMGIDKPNVRFVIHYNMAQSLEGYYQEAGRAGRDGKPSECILLVSAGDAGRVAQIVQGGARRKKNAATAVELLDKVKDFCRDSSTCRHRQLAAYFGEEYSRRCQTSCDSCLRARGQQPHPAWYLEEDGQPAMLDRCAAAASGRGSGRARGKRKGRAGSSGSGRGRKACKTALPPDSNKTSLSGGAAAGASARGEDKEIGQAAQAFQELQSKFIQSTAQKNEVLQKLSSVVRTGRLASLTREELIKMPSDTVTYENIGKAYFLSPKQETVDSLELKLKDCASQQSNLLSKKDALERQTKATENELRELLQHSPALVQAIAQQ
ncbi:hypothetical protein WJX73_003938 [Symbiochloris irregularis]|uniref:ATP-dependent DNA helicase n=1 Tax=Symbiochloris irregularis TaxID=706552 RepID=A0AAW1PEU6_9CHLO